jgi:hypothetical protein
LKKKNKEPKQKEKAEVGHSIGYLYAKGLYLAGYKKRTREEYLESLRISLLILGNNLRFITKILLSKPICTADNPKEYDLL